MISAKEGAQEACFRYLEDVIARAFCRDGVLASIELLEKTPGLYGLQGANILFPSGRSSQRKMNQTQRKSPAVHLEQ